MALKKFTISDFKASYGARQNLINKLNDNFTNCLSSKPQPEPNPEPQTDETEPEPNPVPQAEPEAVKHSLTIAFDDGAWKHRVYAEPV